jgi:hypothetical protein
MAMIQDGYGVGTIYKFTLFNKNKNQDFLIKIKIF